MGRKKKEESNTSDNIEIIKEKKERKTRKRERRLKDEIKHVLIPLHEVITDEEKEKLKKTVNIRKFPLISIKDPSISHLDVKSGDIIRIKRGCGSWECACGEPHSIPFKVEGKCASVEVKFIPAPKGLRLACSNELKKILKLAGIKDVWSKSKGQTKTRMNHIFACFEALKQLSKTKTRSKFEKFAGAKEGALSEEK